MEQKTFKIGQGILTWPASERRNDTYGLVYLMSAGNSLCSEEDLKFYNIQQGNLPSMLAPVRLTAKVIEARQSTHIGDLYHQVFPSMPKVGEEIVLGEGYFTYRVHPSLPSIGIMVGIEPFDKRPKQKMDIHALYRAHEQTVELIAVEIDKEQTSNG
jgi:hypothetical protein